MCGASSQQNQIASAQANYLSTLTSQYQTEFGENQAILATLTSTLSPIVAAGPNQQGYSPTEIASLNTQAAESTAQGYHSAAMAEGEQEAAAGGGNIPLTSAAQEQLKSGLMENATNQLSKQETGILSAGFAQGNQNFTNATGALSGASGSQENPLSNAAGQVTGAGSAAMTSATSVNNANNQWEGLLGGLASSALNTWASD